MQTQKLIWLAADGLSLPQSLELVSKTRDRVYGIKIHDLWDLHGPGVVDQLRTAGAPRVWVDLKLKDIPKTVARRSAAVKKSGADALTVMADGEIEMMMSALEHGPEIYAVTVLTTLTDEQVELTYGRSAKAAALSLARLARLAKVPGVICSAKEVAFLAKRPELNNMILTTPGVRSLGQKEHDQKRVDTPANAINFGSTRLVVGRQITEALDPLAALDQLEAELPQAPAAPEGGSA